MAEIAENPQGGGGKKGRSKKASPRVDLTPMVDLAFLLITFFMLTTSLSKPKAMEIALPETDPQDIIDQPPVDDDVVMTVLLAPKNVVLYYFGSPEKAAADPNGIKSTTFDKESGIRKVILDKKKAVAALPDNLGFDSKKNNKTMVLIKAVDSSVYGNMVDVLDEMHIADIKFYAILPISDPEKVLVDNSMKKVVEK
ncbi:MAG: ExbD/TolR family protein [Chitinophagales bacterium]|jgi:biopolymer transport protein ExbD|nr:biopolymer transporter ExbD [Sphingobacteriales bacterium]